MDSNRQEGIGLFGALGLIFIVLKLTGIIAWSWWWVLAPFWIPTSLFLVAVVILLLVSWGKAIRHGR